MPLKQVTKSSDNSLTTFKVRKTDIKCRIRDENTENFYTVSGFFLTLPILMTTTSTHNKITWYIFTFY